MRLLRGKPPKTPIKNEEETHERNCKANFPAAGQRRIRTLEAALRRYRPKNGAGTPQADCRGGAAPRPPDELPELLRQLSGMAVNINQIAKVANARGFVRMEDIDRIKAMQGLLWRTMKRL